MLSLWHVDNKQFTSHFMLLTLSNLLIATHGWIGGSNGEMDNEMDMHRAYLGWMNYLLVGSLKTRILQ